MTRPLVLLTNPIEPLERLRLAEHCEVTELAAVDAASVLAGAREAQAIIVSNTNNSGAGSLRQAIIDANANGAGTDDVLFSVSLPATINLQSRLPQPTGHMNFDGPNAQLLTISRAPGAPAFGLLDVFQPVQIGITRIGFSNGLDDGSNGGDNFGGGIDAFSAELHLTGVEILGNQSPSGAGLSLANANGVITDVKLVETDTGKVKFGHKLDGAARVVFSPDGKSLATATATKTVQLWDAATGEERAKLKGAPGRTTGIAFSPDGRRVLAFGARTHDHRCVGPTLARDRLQDRRRASPPMRDREMDRRQHPRSPAAEQQHRPRCGAGDGCGAGRDAVAAHELDGRDDRAAVRQGGQDRAAHAAGDRIRIGRDRHRRSARGRICCDRREASVRRALVCRRDPAQLADPFKLRSAT